MCEERGEAYECEEWRRGDASLMAKMEVKRGKVKIRFIVNENATKHLQEEGAADFLEMEKL